MITKGELLPLLTSTETYRVERTISTGIIWISFKKGPRRDQDETKNGTR